MLSTQLFPMVAIKETLNISQGYNKVTFRMVKKK